MARPYPSYTIKQGGHLEIEAINAKLYKVFFTPPAEIIPNHIENTIEYRTHILSIDFARRLATIHPYRVYSVRPMMPRYYVLHTIHFELFEAVETDLSEADNIEDFLYRVLPEAFTEDYNYGLGFKTTYKPIVSMLEDFDVEVLYITIQGSSHISLDKKTASISRSDMAVLVRNIDSITRKAQSISLSLKKDTTSELFFHLVNKSIPRQDQKMVGAELGKRLGKSTRLYPGGATKKEMKEAMFVIRNNTKEIINEHPEDLVKLKNDIELVTLEELIAKFRTMLKNHLKEDHWQKLFDHNPFILNMAFGVPVIKVQEQATLGGIKLSGSGAKIADYLVKNSISNNAAIIEIKTPATKLIDSRQYRGGIFPPSKELAGAVNQVLDQISHFQKNIDALKIASKEYELQSHSVQGILIAGTSLMNDKEQKSFDLFRYNSKSVQIITFDELLKKLSDLYSFLSNGKPSGKSVSEMTEEPELDDLPF
jgi:hypothetical protein